MRRKRAQLISCIPDVPAGDGHQAKEPAACAAQAGRHGDGGPHAQGVHTVSFYYTGSLRVDMANFSDQNVMRICTARRFLLCMPGLAIVRRCYASITAAYTPNSLANRHCVQPSSDGQWVISQHLCESNVSLYRHGARMTRTQRSRPASRLTTCRAWASTLGALVDSIKWELEICNITCRKEEGNEQKRTAGLTW